jgi:hypothetical protein
MNALTVPGVRVEARFDVLPAPLAPAGILGAVGVVDRRPAGGGLLAVTTTSEVKELLGPGTASTMPQILHALTNGASEVVVSPVSGGAPASLSLLNPDSVNVLTLRCRSNGAWGNGLFADVRGIANDAGDIVRITLRLLQNGRPVETFSDLQNAPGMPDDLFEVLNRQSKYVVALDPGFAGRLPRPGTYAFADEGEAVPVPEQGGARTLLELLPADGVDPSGLSVVISESTGRLTVRVFQGGLQEEFEDLVMDPDDGAHLPFVLITQSRFVHVRPTSSQAQASQLPRATSAPAAFSGGVAPTVDDYLEAIDRLADDPRIDLVLAAIDPTLADGDVRQIHQALVAHAVVQTDNGAPRIAFGSVTANEQASLERIKDHASSVRNRRFVLVSPAGAEGAVAGMVGRMSPQEAPTFKPLPLFGIPPARYREAQLNRLLSGTTNLLVVQDRAGRGVVVLKGIDTTGDQISVTRVADQVIRMVKGMSENFIGLLNTDDARLTLKQQIVASLTRMEREGALVPSTDGKDPAFFVNVFSTQQDFAQGIVRIELAVRPVRSIDYVYATIRVKN